MAPPARSRWSEGVTASDDWEARVAGALLRGRDPVIGDGFRACPRNPPSPVPFDGYGPWNACGSIFGDCFVETLVFV